MLEIEVSLDGDEKWISNNCVNSNVAKIHSSTWLNILMERIGYVAIVGHHAKRFLFNVAI